MEFTTVNPATQLPLKNYTYMAESTALATVDRAAETAYFWREKTPAERAQAVLQWGDQLLRMKEELALSMTMEMGKPLTESRAEIDKSIKSLRYIAEHGPSWLLPHKIAVDEKTISIEYQPLGVVMAIMPWNFPLWQVVRCAGPALLAGNVVLLKAADRTAGSAEILCRAAEGLFDQGALLIQTQVDHQGAARMMAHPSLKMVSFTGSSRGGRQVAAEAARFLKKTVLELGGSDPYLVLEDADLDLAAHQLAESRLRNGGQSCIAAKRFLVHRSLLPTFKEKLVQQFRVYDLGDPLLPTTKMGPLASAEFALQLEQQVQKALKSGGDLIVGGAIDRAKGPAFFPATLIEFKKNPLELREEEFFGPVALLIPFDQDSEAIAIANDSPFGLGGAVFSNNLERALCVARQIESGSVAINDYVKSDVRVPFGGNKSSGWGRELADLGIHEFCNIQSLG